MCFITESAPALAKRRAPLGVVNSGGFDSPASKCQKTVGAPLSEFPSPSEEEAFSRLWSLDRLDSAGALDFLGNLAASPSLETRQEETALESETAEACR